MQIMLPAEEEGQRGEKEEARRRCCVRSGTCELICWVVCSKSIAALQSITNDTQDTPLSLPPSYCLPAPVEDGWMETCGGLFILHKCCPKYCSCKHIMIAAAADRNLMIVLNGTRPWPCLGKYLFKIPHATAHMKRERREERWVERACPLGASACCCCAHTTRTTKEISDRYERQRQCCWDVAAARQIC